ncbi:MAG: QueG-associated DUF1730 domain-containing protein [Sedimentisphaerales bacterium]
MTEQIKQKALEIGFDLVGVTDASPIPAEHVNHLVGWLNAGHAGTMSYMHRNLDKRTNPAKLLPGAQSVIVVGLNYKPSQQPTPEMSQDDGRGRIAAYACYEDYHPFIKKQLRKLVDFLVDTTGHGLKFKICVDSSPLLERALAVRAGLGFIGKNHALVNPRLGPQILLGEIITNLELKSEIDAQRRPEQGARRVEGPVPKSEIDSECDSCSKCLSACPTGALGNDGSFDATKCISYLTIESKAEIPADLTPKIGNHLFGCAECLLACPYQHSAPSCANKEFVFHPDRAELDLNEVINLTEDEFHSRFANSPILRAGLSHLQRTARICLENLRS